MSGSARHLKKPHRKKVMNNVQVKTIRKPIPGFRRKEIVDRSMPYYNLNDSGISSDSESFDGEGSRDKFKLANNKKMTSRSISM